MQTISPTHDGFIPETYMPAHRVTRHPTLLAQNDSSRSESSASPQVSPHSLRSASIALQSKGYALHRKWVSCYLGRLSWDHIRQIRGTKETGGFWCPVTTTHTTSTVTAGFLRWRVGTQDVKRLVVSAAPEVCVRVLRQHAPGEERCWWWRLNLSMRHLTTVCMRA